jgi:hypothetical protein
LLFFEFSGILPDGANTVFSVPSMNIYVAAVLTLAPIGLALVFLYRTLASQQDLSDSMDQLLVPTNGKYRPMERLLGEEDFRFLASQPGYSPKMGRRLRTERRQIFRGYLRNLSRDFRSISAACRTLLVHSAEDRAELASSLIRQQLLFGVGMLAVEGRLVLHAAGIGTVDVRGLVESLESMQTQVRILLAPPQAIAASM